MNQQELRRVRHVIAYPTREEAEEALPTYSELLVQRGDTDRFGVFVRRIPSGGWGVFLKDRAV